MTFNLLTYERNHYISRSCGSYDICRGILFTRIRNSRQGGGHKGIFFSVRTTENPLVKSYIDNNFDGTYTPKWRKDDALGVFVGDINTKSEIATLYNTEEDGPTANFEGTLDATASGVFKSMAPKQSFEEFFEPIDGAEVIGVALGNAQEEYVQHPTYETIDEDCDILVSKPVSYTSDGKTVALDDIYFKRIMSIVKINVKGSESLTKEKLHNFTMTSSDAVLCGSAKVDITNAKVIGWTEERKSLTAVYSTENDMPSVNEEMLNTVYLVANPTTLASGSELTFSGETDNYTFTKTITLPKDIVFPESQIAVINLTLSDEQLTATTWTATELSDITADDEVVITMKSGNNVYALTSKNGSSSSPDAIVVEISAEELANAPEDDLIWNISNANGTLTIYPNGQTDKWLYTTDNNNGVRVGTNANKNFIVDDNYLKNTTTNRYLGIYGIQDWRCYSKTDGNIANQTLCLYVKGNAKTALDTPANLNISDKKIISWDAVSGAASYNVSIGSETYTTEANSYDASDVEDEYYDVAVVAIPSDKDNYKNSAAATLTDAKFGTPTLATPVLKEGAIDETSINVTWDADTRATEGYSCEIYNGDTKVADDLVLEGSVTFKDLNDGQTYTIKVKAEAVSGEKEYAASESASIELTTKPTYHVKDVTAAGSYTIKNLKVYAIPTTSNAIIGDGTGYLVFYKTKHGLKVGDTFDAAGNVELYNGIWEYSNATISNQLAGEAPEYVDAVEATEAYLTAYATASSVQYVHAKGLQNGRNITVGSQTLYLSPANNATDGKNVEVYGFVFGYYSQKENISFVATSIKENLSAPTLTIDQTSKTWASTETDAFVVNVSVNADGGDWEVTPTTLDWATITVDKAAGTITVTPKGENTSDTAYEVTLTVTHTADASLTKTITLKQNGAGATEPVICYTLTPSKGSNATYTKNCDIEINNIIWNLTGNSTMLPWRIGGKTLTKTDRALYSKTAISDNIVKIVVTHGNSSNATVNSMTLTVHNSAEDAASGNNAISTVVGEFTANGSVTFNADTNWNNKFYRIVYNLTTTGTSNAYISFSKADFYK